MTTLRRRMIEQALHRGPSLHNPWARTESPPSLCDNSRLPPDKTLEAQAAFWAATRAAQKNARERFTSFEHLTAKDGRPLRYPDDPKDLRDSLW